MAGIVGGRVRCRESAHRDIADLRKRRPTSLLRCTGSMDGGTQVERKRRVTSSRRGNFLSSLVVDPENGDGLGRKIFERRVCSRLSLKRGLASEGVTQQFESGELSSSRID